MKNEKFKNNRFCKVFVFLFVLVVCFSVLGFAGYNSQKIKASTQYYDENFQEYVINDWENYETKTQAGITMENQGDGTFLVNGTASSITEFVLPTTITSISNTYYYDWYAAILLNNNFNYSNTTVRMYLAYNNGQNITTNSCYVGRTNNGSDLQNINNVCLVLRFNENASFTNDVFTPFFCLKYRTDGTTYNFSNGLSINMINSLLGPTSAYPENPDLTKVNYISSAEQTSLVISTQTNMTFGNELQNLIQYSFEAGDTITVDNTGETALYIDLLTMTAGNDSYIMRFNNDAQSNDYLSVYLYKNNNYVYFYNDNTGEITAGNITAFRTWGVDAINNGATIASGSQYNNNIINKIFVYSTGTNYETGYTNGYRDGYDAGEADGFEDGTANGYGLGYAEGYDQGAIDGLDTSWLVNLFEAVNTFFNITILPGIKIGTIFAIPFVLSIAWVIIRILRGGGYGD